MSWGRTPDRRLPVAPAALALALALALAAAACGGGGETPVGESAGACQRGDERAGLIAERLTHGATALRNPWAVALEPPVDNYFYVVAAEIEGTGLEDSGRVGVWGMGSHLSGARIMALDAAARRWSDWGTAIPERSPAGEQRRRMEGRPETDRARACVARGPAPPGA